MDQNTYPCPSFHLRASISIRCDLSPGDQSGFCNLSESVPTAPDLPAGAIPLKISEPQDGDVFTNSAAIEFQYSVAAAHFLLVMDAQPKTTDDIVKNAIWGAAFPRSRTADRLVHWADGVQIRPPWQWQNTPGEAPPKKDLYAVVVAVDGGKIVAQATQSPRFRVETGWPAAGAPCRASAADDECYNPRIVQSCIGTSCEKLCLKDADCESPSYCKLDMTPPYCSR